MKNKEKKELKKKLLTAFEKVIRDNKAHLTSKVERNLKKSIKQIVRKTDEKRNAIPSRKTRKSISNSDKVKMDGTTTVRPGKPITN
jgi:L-lactate utilization protein LutC